MLDYWIAFQLSSFYKKIFQARCTSVVWTLKNKNITLYWLENLPQWNRRLPLWVNFLLL